MNYLMGIDMGGTMIKAAVFDENGKEIIVCKEKLKVIYPGKEMDERDILQAKESIYSVIKKAITSSHVSNSDIKGIGVTGQANGLYMFDKAGEPTHNAVLSSDMRAKNYVKKWKEDGTWENLLPEIRQQIWPGNVPALIAWFKDHEKAVLDRTSVIVTAKDFVRYVLTGQFCMERTEASAIACMDQTTGKFTKEIFEKLGIEDYLRCFPEKIVDSIEIAGKVTKKCAELTGLKEGTPVVGGQIDTGASIISIGVIDETQMGIIVGTWGINSIIKNEPVTSKDIFMVYPYCIPGYYCVMEGSSTSATNIEWFIENFLKREQYKDVYFYCDDLVKDTPYKDSILFLPFLYGSNVEIDAKSSFIGLKGRHGKPEMIRAIYEGVVFCHKYHIERLLKFADNIKTVRMAGGAARSEIWMQMFADILEVPVEVSESSELGAMGVALEAGVGVGIFDNVVEASGKWTRIKKTYYPDQERSRYYRSKYEIYKEIITTLGPLWGKIDRLC